MKYTLFIHSLVLITQICSIYLDTLNQLHRLIYNEISIVALDVVKHPTQANSNKEIIAGEISLNSSSGQKYPENHPAWANLQLPKVLKFILLKHSDFISLTTERNVEFRGKQRYPKYLQAK